MHWVKVINPQYERSRHYSGQVGEVIGGWGPENSAEGRTGYMVQFSDGEVVGLTEEELEDVDEPGPFAT